MIFSLRTCTRIHYQAKLVGQRFYTTLRMNCICVCWDIQQFIMLICILLLSLVGLFLMEQGIVTLSQTIVLFQKTSKPTSILGKFVGFSPPPSPLSHARFALEISSLGSCFPIWVWVPPQLGIFNNPSFRQVSVDTVFSETMNLHIGYFLKLHIIEDNNFKWRFECLRNH